MKNKKLEMRAFALLLCLVAAACSSPPPRPALPDGVYLVLAEDPDRHALRPADANETILAYKRSFAPRPKADPVAFLLVSRAPFVPLELAAPARVTDDGEERASIQLDFTAKSGAILERLTAEWAGRGSMAVVIGDEVITVHKIREAIRGGQIQVSCCAEGAFEFLADQLRDND